MFKSILIRGTILLVLFLIDLYVFQAVRLTTEQRSVLTQKFIFYGYYLLSIYVAIIVIMTGFIDFHEWPKAFRQNTTGIIMAVYVAKILVIPFLMIDDVIRGVSWVSSRLFVPKAESLSGISPVNGISRMKFISYLGLGIAAVPFVSLLYGMLYGKYRFKVRKISLTYPNLPSNFDGLKIVQFSDFHIGSFTDRQNVQDAIQLINEQKPDIIFFTGDLVNDRASEIDEFFDIVKNLEAKLGIYSILGNHDYGDYFQWNSMQEKLSNMEKLKKTQKDLGWRLLLNENVDIVIDNQKISLIGIENWSAVGRFPKYGNLEKAMQGVENDSFKVLLSHDPSHWQNEVTSKYQNIHLTLSGHTHGMQFGIEIPGFKWSPVQYVYKYWAGLYKKGQQFLYVNRGLGFIGYPGRVGILPEITVFQLNR